MGIPIVYRKSGETAIASYNYIDIAEGTGIVTFYGAETEDNGTKDYSLLLNTIYSNDIFTSGTAQTSAMGLDIDFDVTFNIPKIIKGIVRANVSWLQGDETVANKSGNSYAVMKIRKWDGTTETEIAANTKSKELAAADLTVNGITVMMEVNVASRVHFKAGETLRITIEIWGGNTVGGSGTNLWLCHDPKDRTIDYTDLGQGAALTGNVDTTQMVFQVPFVLDL